MKNAPQAWVLDVLAAGLVLFGVVHVARVLPSRTISNDFAHYYISSRLLLTGADVYSTPMKPEYERWGFHYAVEIPRATNPPFLVGIFAPFAALPPRAAFWAWVTLEILSLGCLLVLTWRLTASRLSAQARRLVCAGIIASAPVYWHFVFSQCQLLIGAIILIAYMGLRNGRPARACLAITAATWLKLFPAVLVPWFLWRSSRDGGTRAKCAVVTLGWSVALVVGSGWDNWKQFWASGMRVVQEWIKWQRHFDFTVPSFVKNTAWFSHGFDLTWAGLDGWVRIGAIVGFAFIALMYGLVWWSARRRKDPDIESEFCLLTIAMLAGNAQGWGHYYVMLAFPFAIAMARVTQRPTPGRIAILAFSLVMLNVMGDWRITWLEFTVSYIPLYGLLLLGAFFVNETLNSRPPPTSSTRSALSTP